jgi:hypothetical protein
MFFPGQNGHQKNPEFHADYKSEGIPQKSLPTKRKIKNCFSRDLEIFGKIVFRNDLFFSTFLKMFFSDLKLG